MAFTRPIRHHHFPLSDQPVPLLLCHRSLFLSPDLHLVSSGGLRQLRLSIPAARNRRVEDVSEERRSGALAKGKRDSTLEVGPRDSALEVGKPDDGGLSTKDGVYEGFEWKWTPWKDLPMAYKLVGTTSLAFVVCNMDKRFSTTQGRIIIIGVKRWGLFVVIKRRKLQPSFPGNP